MNEVEVVDKTPREKRATGSVRKSSQKSGRHSDVLLELAR